MNSLSTTEHSFVYKIVRKFCFQVNDAFILTLHVPTLIYRSISPLFTPATSVSNQLCAHLKTHQSYCFSRGWFLLFHHLMNSYSRIILGSVFSSIIPITKFMTKNFFASLHVINFFVLYNSLCAHNAWDVSILPLFSGFLTQSIGWLGLRVSSLPGNPWPSAWQSPTQPPPLWLSSNTLFFLHTSFHLTFPTTFFFSFFRSLHFGKFCRNARLWVFSLCFYTLLFSCPKLNRNRYVLL